MPKDNEVTNLDDAITKARSEFDFAMCRGPRAMEAREKRLAQIVCLLELAKHDHAATVAELRAKADAAERRVGELEELMAAARRAIGDHHAPNDCYATGPLTGDEFLDLAQCPACAFLEQHEAITGADPT